MHRKGLVHLTAYGAAALGLLSAGVSAYWTLGGTALLSTVGGDLEALARRGGSGALLLGTATTVAKLAAVVLALALVRPWGRRLPRRLLTRTAGLGGALVSAYGAVQLAAGGAALTGLTAAPPADPAALRWHVLFWDPWFLLWGALLAGAALLSRGSGRTSPVRIVADPHRRADRTIGTARHERIGARERGVLLVVCGAIFLEGVDVAMLNVALPAIRADLGLSTPELGAVVSAYVLGYGGFLLLGGRAGDLLGHRRVFLAWLTVFLVFSGLGGLASEGWVLLLARFVTGVAAAFMTPAGLALVTERFPEGPARTRALGLYAGTAAAGFTLGLVIGGLLTPLGWRWVFFAPVLISGAILLAAVPLLRGDGSPPRPVGPRGRFDVAGALLITAAMLLLASGVVGLERVAEGWLRPLGTIALGLALLAGFVAVERRAPSPLIRLGVLRSAALVRTDLAALLFIGAFAGFQFLVTLYLQEVRGWSPLATGLALLVVGIDVVLAPTLTPRLVDRYGVPPVLLSGFLLAAAGYALFLPLGVDWAYLTMLPAFLLLGLAFSLAYGPLTMAATEGTAPEEHGLASGLLYTAIQFGTALGLSAVSAVVALAGSEATQIEALRSALVVPLVAAAVGAVLVASGLRRRPAAAEAVPVPDGQGHHLSPAGGDR